MATRNGVNGQGETGGLGDGLEGVPLDDDPLDRALLELFGIDLPSHRDTPWSGQLCER